MPWDAQLAHQKNVERDVQGSGYLVGDGDAAARQREHDDVLTAFVVAKQLGEQAARFGSVPKSCHPQ